MTSPAAIQGAGLWSRWSNMNHPPQLVSEGRSRLPGGGNRLLPLLRYGFLLLALGLMLSDTFRLAFSRNASPDVSPRPQPVHHARTVHAISHARIAGAKRHSGV